MRKLHDSVNIIELQDICGFTVKNEITNLIIDSVATIQNANHGSVCFLSNKKYLRYLLTTKATACFVTQDVANNIAETSTAILISENPALSFAKFVAYLYGSEEYYPNDGKSFIAESARIAKTAIIGKGVKIMDYVTIDEDVIIGDNTIVMQNTFIGRGVSIGKNCYVYNNVSISDATIGDRCIIRSGSIIGGMGFGFVYDKSLGISVKNVHISNVIISDDVDIGSNTTVDRGYIQSTIIGRGTKIDNLVQIAHGVQIGRNCLLVAQVGIAGSTIIGDSVTFAGQSGCVGHLNICSNTIVSIKSCVTNNINKPDTYIGFPAEPFGIWSKTHAFVKLLFKKSQKHDNS